MTTTTTTLTDPQNRYSWTQKEIVLGSDGFRVAANFILDDGRTRSNTYLNNVIFQSISSDPVNVKPWTTFTKTFDIFSGYLLNSTRVMDDGRVVTNTFKDGVLEERTVTDESDAHQWSSRALSYDSSGRIVSTTTDYDDGRIDTTNFVDGVKTIRTISDASDAYDWTSKTFDYNDVTGKLETITTLLDSGVSQVVSPAAGPSGQTIHEMDTAGNRVWESRTKSFDADGNLSSNVVTFDDGVVRTTTFTSGSRDQSVWQDVSDTKAWEHRTATYDAANRLSAWSVTHDDGRVSLTSFQGGVRATRDVTDLQDAHLWASTAEVFDTAGRMKTFTRTFDDGRIATTNYVDGTRQSQIVTDTQDTQAWVQTRKAFDADNGSLVYTHRVWDDGQETFKDARGQNVVTGGIVETVVEDSADILQTGGTITLSKGYRGASDFVPVASIPGDNGYGTFELSADGTWTYSASNDQLAIQALNRGDTLTDSFDAVTSDGVKTTITVEIEGARNAPVLAGETTHGLGTVGSLSGPGGQIDLGALFSHDDGEAVTITATGLPNGVTLSNGILSRSDTADLLLAGDHVVSVTATDAANISTTVEITLAIALTHDFEDGFHASLLDGPTLEGSSGEDDIRFGLQTGSTASLDVTTGAGNDSIAFGWAVGSWDAVTIDGGEGDDLVTLGAGTPHASGGEGFDTVSLVNADQGVHVDLRSAIDGSQFIDMGANAVLSGFEAVVGSAHDDTLIAGHDYREMTGGAGADVFVLAGHVEDGLHQISDFDASQDTVEFDSSVFDYGSSEGVGGQDPFIGNGPTQLPGGGQDPFGGGGGGDPADAGPTGAYFVSNTTGAAQTAETRVIYNTTTGTVSFDSDGTGAEQAVQVANIGAGHTLNEGHFQFGALHQRAPIALDVALTVSANKTDLLPLPLGDVNVAETLTYRFHRELGDFSGSAAIVYPGYMHFLPIGQFDHLREGQSVTQTMHYSVTDESGQQDFGVVALTVLGAEDAPAARPDWVSGTEDTDLVIFPLANDDDPDGGVLRISAVDSVDEGTLVIAADGQSITFTPNPEFHGSVTLDYEIIDDLGTPGRGKIYVNITSVDDAPVAQDISAEVDEDGSVVLVPVFTDADVGDTSTIRLITPGLEGTANVQADGTILYTASGLDALVEGEVFTETFTYMVIDDDDLSDPADLTATAQVSVTVTGRDDLPVTAPDSYTFVEDSAALLTPLLNDDDLDDGQFLRITGVNLVQNGTAEVLNADQILFTPDLHFTGQTQFEYQVTSTNGGISTEQITLDFTPVNDRPVLNDVIPPLNVDPRIQTEIDGPIPEGRTTFAFNEMFSDPDGDALTYEVLFDPSETGPHLPGTVTMVTDLGDGAGPGFHYDAPIVEANRTLPSDVTEEILVRATDPDGLQDFFRFDVKVDGIDYAPFVHANVGGHGAAELRSFVTEGDGPVALGVKVWDGNGPSSAYISGLRNTSAGGTFEIAPNKRDIIYTPDDGFWGAQSFEVQLTDNTGLMSPWTAQDFIVDPVLDTPDVSMAVSAGDRFDQFVVTLTAQSNEDERINFWSVDLEFEDGNGNPITGFAWNLTSKLEDSVTTSQEFLVTVPSSHIDLFLSGELTLVGSATTAYGVGDKGTFSLGTAKKKVGVTKADATVQDVVAFEDASLWAPEDDIRHVQGYDLGGTVQAEADFAETLFLVDARALGIGVTSHVSVSGGVDVSVSAELRPEVWIEGGSIDGAVGFDAQVQSVVVDDTGYFGFATSATPNATKSWFQAESPNTGFDISLTELGFSADASLGVGGYAHLHTGADTYGPTFNVGLDVPEVNVNLAGNGISFISYDGAELSFLNGLINVPGTSIAQTFRSPGLDNELGYVGLQKPELTVDKDSTTSLYSFFDSDYHTDYGYHPLDSTTTIAGSDSADFANLQLDLDGIAATIKSIKNPVDLNEGLDAGVIAANVRLEALDLDLRADFAYQQTNALTSHTLLGRIVVENGDVFDFEFGDVVDVGAVDDFDINGDGQVAYQVFTKARAVLSTDADVNLHFYDYFAALNASGSVTTSGAVKDVLDDVGIPSSYSLGTGGPLFERSGTVFNKWASLDFAESSYLMMTDWNEAGWSYV